MTKELPRTSRNSSV